MMQAALGVERSLPGKTTLGQLVNSRGDHALRTRDINAPMSATLPGRHGCLPYPGYGPIYQYETSGIYKQTQIITNLSTRFNPRFYACRVFMRSALRTAMRRACRWTSTTPASTGARAV